MSAHKITPSDKARTNRIISRIIGGVASGGATFDPVEDPKRRQSSPLGVDHRPCYGEGECDTVRELSPNNQQPLAHQSPSRQSEHSNQGDGMKASTLFAITTIVVVLGGVYTHLTDVKPGKLEVQRISLDQDKIQTGFINEHERRSVEKKAIEAYEKCLDTLRKNPSLPLTCQQPYAVSSAPASATSLQGTMQTSVPSTSSSVVSVGTPLEGSVSKIYAKRFACGTEDVKKNNIKNALSANSVMYVFDSQRYVFEDGCGLLNLEKPVKALSGQGFVIHEVDNNTRCEGSDCLSYLNNNLNKSLVFVVEYGKSFTLN